MHLSQLAVDAYVAGVRPASVERHVRVCCWCAQRLAVALVSSSRWERRGLLQRLVRVDDPLTLGAELDRIFPDAA
jgi:hypothetical protein